MMMAAIEGASRSVARLKSPGTLSYQHPIFFKTFILQFVRSLGKDDREAFRFYCTSEIPREKLDIDVNDDGDIFKLIEFLQNDNKLSFTDMSLLKEFLLAVKRFDLLEILKKVELRIAIGIILEGYKHFSNNLHQGSAIAYNMYADVVELLVSTKEKSQEMISQALEQLRQVGDDSIILYGVIRECQQNPQLPWPEVTALFVIMGELYSAVSSDCEVEEDFKTTTELFAEWMLKRGGLKDFESWIKKKPKFASNGSALSSIGESLKECMKLIGHQLHMEPMA